MYVVVARGLGGGIVYYSIDLARTNISVKSIIRLLDCELYLAVQSRMQEWRCLVCVCACVYVGAVLGGSVVFKHVLLVGVQVCH